MPYCTSLKDAFREGKKDVGTKAYNLSLLMSFGFPVPRGFVIKAQCFSDLAAGSGLKDRIGQILSETNVDDPAKLSAAAREIKRTILSSEIPKSISDELVQAYSNASGREDMQGLNDVAKSIMSAGRSEASIAVRASYANDESRNSFAGCARACLNVRGRVGFLDAVKSVWASCYSEHAIYYREKTGNQNTGFAMLVQLMVNPEKAGAIATANPLTGDKNQEIIEAVWGTGEAISLGATTPDRYTINKESRMISDYTIGRKEWIYSNDDFDGGTKKEPVSEKNMALEVLSHPEIKAIEEIARKIDERAGVPQDVEWAILRGRIYVLGARQIMFSSEGRELISVPPYSAAKIAGTTASRGSAEGKPIMLYDSGLTEFAQGEIILLRDATPSALPLTKSSSAVISEGGGMLSAASTLFREFRIPSIVGAKGIIGYAEKSVRAYVDATRGKIYFENPAEKAIAPLAEAPTAPQAQDDACALLATKIRLVAKSHEGEEKFDTSDGVFLSADTLFSSAMPDGMASSIAKVAERAHPAGIWVKMPRADSAELGAAAAGIHGAVSRGYRNICAIIPSVYSRSHVEEAKNTLASSGMDMSSVELGILIDNPAGAVMACEFAQSGVTIACIDSDALIKNMFGLPDGAKAEGLEMHPAFLQMLERCIRACRKQKMHTAFSGHASVDPRMIEKLVEFGIDSICVQPEHAGIARYISARAEKKMLIEILKNRDKFFRKDVP